MIFALFLAPHALADSDGVAARPRETRVTREFRSRQGALSASGVAAVRHMSGHGFTLRSGPIKCAPGADSLYFIQSVFGGPVKIGRAADPQKRLSELQMGNPEELRIVLLCEGGGAFEDDFHSLLYTARVGGEWYDEDAVAQLLERMHAPEYLVEEIRMGVAA